MSCKCVIMQPTYLPWMGYFDLLDQATVFVFLDNVQFSKQTWQQRNRIHTDKGLELLTVPVYVKGRSGQLIQDVQIRPSAGFPTDHLKAIELHYHRAPYFSQWWEPLREILSTEESSLCSLNIRLIRWLASSFGIEPRLQMASELPVQGRRSHLLVDICRHVGSEFYLSPIGSAEYLLRDAELFREASIKILFHNFHHPKYRQVYKPFLFYASAIDLLFNEGERSLEIIRSGRRPSLLLKKIGEDLDPVTPENR